MATKPRELDSKGERTRLGCGGGRLARHAHELCTAETIRFELGREIRPARAPVGTREAPVLPILRGGC